MKRNIKTGVIAFITCISISLCGCGEGFQSEREIMSSAGNQQKEERKDDIVSESEKTTETAEEEQETTEQETTTQTTTETTTTEQETTTETTTTIPPTEPPTEAPTEAPATEASDSNKPAEETAGNTYEHNEYYDVVEAASFKDFLGYTTVIIKVLAKKDVSISSTMLATASDGNIVGKSSDDIVLTEGKYNFFRYYFDQDISNADIQANAEAKNDSFMVGERNAVEMVQYNQSGNNLYVTFEQTGDTVSSFAKFKLLFYKGDSIVDTEDGFFSLYAGNLNGKGSTDVAEILVIGKDFDRVEYIYEP